MLFEVYGKECLSRAHVFEWHNGILYQTDLI